jgi:hypothetical protein
VVRIATIQIILQAINDASRTFNDVADAAENLATVQEVAAESARTLTDAEVGAANAAVQAIAAYSELRASANDLAVANVNAANASIGLAAGIGEASRGAITAATAYGRLSDAQLTAANTAVAAMDAEKAMGDALGSVMAESLNAAGGLRMLSQAELDAASGALRTAFAVRALSAAEIASINASLEWAASLNEAGNQAAAAAGKATAAAAAIAVLNRQISDAGTQARNAITGFNFWGGVMGVLTQKIPLWGGLLDGLAPKILTQVTAWHLWGDAVIEVIAVWGAAAIAVGAWGVAASDAVNNVIRQVTNMHTVSDATGQSFNALSGNLERLHQAVQPQVYQLFGDALTVAAAKGGELNQVIMQTGQVIDQLGARAALAIQGSQFSSFIGNAVTDVRLLGTAFGNLFGIVGNLIRMNQGWATTLLAAGTAILGLIERVTSLIIPLGQVLVLGHGFVLWVGLAVTAALKLGPILLGWGSAIADAAAYLYMLGAAFLSVAASEGVLEAVNALMIGTGGPFVWAAAAAAALVGLVLWLNNAKDAAQTFNASIQQALQKAPIQDLAATIAGSITATNTQVAASTQQVTKAVAEQGPAVTGVASRFESNYNPALNRASDLQQHYIQGAQQLTAQQQMVGQRVGELAQQYGGVTNAMALLSAAGITSQQMLDKSASTWAIVKQQVQATYQAYQAMGQQAGTLGNDLAVLNKQATDQYSAIQKLNQAWDTQTTAMTGTQTAFDTIAQGFNTLNNNAATFTETLGTLRVTGLQRVKDGIDQLTPSGIALNQAFAQQVTNVNALADSWRSAGLSQNIFNSGLAAAIAPLEQYAQGSQEATDQLVGLAQEAGYQGPANLQALNQYLGITGGMLTNTAGDMNTLKQAANQATQQEALLTTSMQNQGAAIANQLIGNIQNAILQYNGVQRAATAYGTALAAYGRQSSQAQTATNNLETALINAGKAAGDSTTQIAAMITKVLGIPPKVALEIVMNGAGSFTISGGSVVTPNASGGIHISPGTNLPGGTAGPGFAFGGVLPGWGGGDRIHILAEAGETILPKEATGDPLTRLVGRKYKVPGFQSGGVVLGGDTSVLSGQRAWTDYNQFTVTFESAMVHAMQGAIAGAEKAASAAGAAPAAGGGGGEGKSALQAAASARGWGSGAEWNALNAVEMREAGYSLTAKNPSSGAYGMAQFINGPSEYYAYGGNPNTAAGQATAMLNYIAQRYGDPIAAWAHEQNFGWYRRGGVVGLYDQGGLLPPGMSVANNQTGSPELVLPNAVVQGFTGGMQELHAPLSGLQSAIKALTAATTAAAEASKAVTGVIGGSGSAAAVKKPAAPPLPTQITADEKTIAADKANAAMLANHLAEVKQAIKDTPASDKSGLAKEQALLKTIETALTKQNAATAKAEATLKAALEKQDKDTISAMQKAIEAITKLLGSGSAATSSSGLWSKLQADENTLKAAEAALKAVTGGGSGGSSSAAKAATSTAANTASSAASLTAIKAQVNAQWVTLDKLYAEEKTAKGAQLTAIKDQVTAVWKVLDKLYAQEDALKKTTPAAAKTPASSGGTGAPSTGAGYTVVVDRKAETDLAEILTQLKEENTQLKQIIAVLGKIQAEADPKAQAAAIGPAVAAAIKVTAGGKSTRRG